MSIQITGARLQGGQDHEHIAHLWWVSDSTSEVGDNTRERIVSWIEDDGGKAFTDDGRGHRADVAVITPTRGAKYLRTHADGEWTNNLLALPRR